jgi:hypothetical protein
MHTNYSVVVALSNRIRNQAWIAAIAALIVVSFLYRIVGTAVSLIL